MVLVVIVAMIPAGCKSKLDTTLNVYNSWVEHSKAVAKTLNEMTNIAYNWAPPGGKVFGRLKEIPEDRMATFEQQVKGFTIPDRSNIDEQLVKGIDGYAAEGQVLAKQFRDYNAVVRSNRNDAAVDAEMTKVINATEQFNARVAGVQGTMEGIIKQAGRKPIRK
jgi:hypothetical protein